MAPPPIQLKVEGDELVLVGRVPLSLLAAQGIPFTRGVASSGSSEVRINWTTERARQLSLLGMPSISRMPLEYDFPANGIKPMPHQIQGADFLVRNVRAYLFLDMGLGKTLTALWALDYLHRAGIIQRALVVAPKSIVYSAWYNEVCTHFPNMTATVITDDYAPRRKQKMKEQTFLHITNHDGPAHFYKELAANKYDVIVYDECTAIKNPKTNRFKGVRHILRPGMSLWLMTGTPTPQSPMDAYGQIRLMHNVDEDAKRCPPSTILGPAFMTEKAWKQKTMAPGNGDSDSRMWFPKRNANEIVHRYMQPAFCRTKGDVLTDLPPVIYFPPREVDPAPDQKEAYTVLRRNMKAEGLNGLKVDAINAAVRVSKIVQIAAGCAYAEDMEAGGDTDGGRLIATFSTAAKDRELLEIIEQAAGKVIVYVPFVAALHRLHEFLNKKGYNAILIDGKVKPKEVHELINVQFQSKHKDSPRIVVAMPQKLSHGITATAASDTVWYSPVVRAEVYQQANNRMDRIGQTMQTNIHHLSGNKTEFGLYSRLTDRTLSQRALLDMYNAFVE